MADPNQINPENIIMPYSDTPNHFFYPENRFIGDIEDGLTYPYACYTKDESDERYAAKAHSVKKHTTVADMIADDTLAIDDAVRTLGYYAVNDSGGAEYIITDDNTESAHYEQLSNGLYARLIEHDIVNLNAYGCTDGSDISAILQSVFNRAKYDKLREIHLYGINCTSNTVITTLGLHSIKKWRVIIDFHNSTITGNGNIFIDGNFDALHKNIIFRNATLCNFRTCFVAFNFNYGCVFENFETQNCKSFLEGVACYYLKIKNVRPQDTDDFVSDRAWIDFLRGGNLIRLDEVYCDGVKAYPYCVKVRDAEAFEIEQCSFGNNRDDGTASLFIESVRCIKIHNSYLEGYRIPIYINGANQIIIVENTFINVMGDDKFIFDVSNGAMTRLEFRGNYIHSGKIFNVVNPNCFGTIYSGTQESTTGYDVTAFITENNIPAGIVLEKYGYIHTDAGLSGLTALTSIANLHPIKAVGSFGDNSTKDCGGIRIKHNDQGTIDIVTKIVYQSTQVILINFSWTDAEHNYKKSGIICGDTFYPLFDNTEYGSITVSEGEDGYLTITLSGDSNIEQFAETIYYNLIG